MELKGKTAIVTGSSGRLGFLIAKALGQAGCNCLCHYHSNKHRAEALAGQIRALGARSLAVQADLTEPDGIEKLFNKAGQFGPPQILINSAAVFSKQLLTEVTFEEAQKVLNLNLTAAILTSREFAKIINTEFPEASAAVGKIINIADVGGIRPWAGYVLYSSSKAGLIGATKALAKELAPAICVNSVAPGVITWADEPDESAKRRQLLFIPAGRFGEPAEIAEAVIFLLGNDYITGQVLNVDGGRCI